MRDYGRFILNQSTNIEVPLGTTVNTTIDPDDREIYARFPDGAVKKMTGSGTGGGVMTASNGLTVVGTDVRFGGELAANTTLRLGPNLGPAYELEITHGTIIQRGGSGANKIVGAGTYHQYAPVHTTLVFGTVSGTQWDVIPNWSLLMGLDNEAPDAALSIINGFNVDIQLGQSTLYGIFNSNNMEVSGYSRTNSYWLDQSSANTYEGAMVHSMTRGESNDYFALPVTNNQDYFHSHITSRNSQFAGSNFSYIHGDGLSIGKEADRSIIFGSSISTAAGTTVQFGFLMGDLIDIPGVATTVSRTMILGNSVSTDPAVTSILDSLIVGNNIFIEPGVETDFVQSSIIVGTGLTIAANSYSLMIVPNGSHTDVNGSVIVSLDNISTENVDNTFISGSNHVLLQSMQNCLVNGVQHTVQGGMENCIVIGNQVITTGTGGNADSMFIGNLINGVENVDTSIVGGQSLTYTAGATLGQSIVFGNAIQLDNTSEIVSSFISGRGLTTQETIDSVWLGGWANLMRNTEYSIMQGHGCVMNPAAGTIKNSIIIGEQVARTAAANSIAALGLGSVAFNGYTGGGILPADDYTIFFENQRSLVPGGYIELVSPDGLTRARVTVANGTGALVSTVIP